ncbi:MAG: glycogen synthase GlgA [Lachnospiraceae bacterium]|nr:glycogen synthase GlgA [Lachnospiraceae bacterium]
MKTNILITGSECVPFIKTGGLADVMGSLPKYFDKERYDVRVMMPLYTCIPQEYRSKMEYVTHFYTGFLWREQYCGLKTLTLDGVRFYFIDNESYFGGPGPYSYMGGDIEKFSFFCRMVLSVLPLINWKPDVIHCNDWQTGLIPVYLNDYFQGDLFFHNIRTIFTIHNLKFQGTYDVATIMNKTGLSAYYFTPDKLEAYGNGNLLKGGLVYSDRITTVSKTYADEICTMEYGEGLDGLLNAKREKLVGIVNGIDTSFYDPANDPDIAKGYTAESVFSGKPEDKAALQRELGLYEDPGYMLIGIISRLTDQKGFDLIGSVMDELMKDHVQVAVLGSGEYVYEEMLRNFAQRYPGRFSTSIFYSEPLSHRIYAGADAFLMPSRFEPCGLSQLMSLRYGTLPIVRETGGLKDTVHAYNENTDEGTGFSFARYDAWDMLNTIRYAERIFFDRRDAWDRMVVRAMKEDFSWDVSARQYEKLYDELAEEKRNAEESAKRAQEAALHPSVRKKKEVKAEEAPAEEAPADTAPQEKPVKKPRKTAAKKAAEDAVTEETAAEKKPAAKKTAVKKTAEEKEPVKKSASRKKAPEKGTEE